MARFPYLQVKPRIPEKEEYAHLKQIPEDAVFLCAYLTFLNPVDFGKSAFFRRIDGEDQLWHGFWDFEANPIWNELELWRHSIYEEFGLSVVAPASVDLKKSALNLFGYLIRNNLGYSCPSSFIMAGLICEEEYEIVVADYKNEIEEVKQEALQQESSIVKAAIELRLGPAPSGISSSSWQASCPGTGHPIYLDTKTNQFGCPWCRKKGGTEQLEAFVKERLAKGYQL